MRVLIADDERIARQRLLSLLEREDDVQIVGECSDGAAAAELLKSRPVDVAFLDIEMPGQSGLEALGFPERTTQPLIVFITAFEQYAVRAFEANAFDYLLKPFREERLRNTLTRLRGHLALLKRQASPVTRDTAVEDVERIPIKSNGRIILLRTDEIDWVEAEHNYVRLHTRGITHLIRETMTALEVKLNSRRFRRIHRSTIVNVDRIREIQPWFRGDAIVILDNGQKLTASRNFRDRLSEWLDRPAR
ncbi:LytR/AlgR family response regulator transcription factor [Bryobacter aggregatus]|uniref:LytR/AlgR family response regulator transcription factor n=1 Tax=Bryobacter aggregatus TaxID=360054 RepID=UPI0004E26306|nr:LytTR family DNA-binding domain-containing protein [Bryobacter aggregatus]